VEDCPWCTKKPIVYEMEGEWIVSCVNDDCPVQPDLARPQNSEAQAVEVWNTRGEPTDQ
jgi:hypothetical protein